MAGGGWGKKAAGKLATDRKLEDDELFKQIGGQLDGSRFDYSQWQRTYGKPATGPAEKTSQQMPSLQLPDVIVGHAGGTLAAKKKTAASSQHVCQHGQRRDINNGKKSVQAAYEEAIQKKKAEQIKILELRIQTRKQTLAEYRRREAELLLANMQLQDEIGVNEKDAHEDVKKLLRKYEKFRGGISTLNDRFVQDLCDAKKDLEKIKSRTETDLQELQSQVDGMESLVQEEQSKLTMLMNYKDKEYPVKALRMFELQQEIGSLGSEHQEEEADLRYIVENEVEQFQKQENSIKKDITEKVMEDAICKMHPSLRDMAMQNLVMEKEIDYHRKDLEALVEANRELEKEVKTLLRDPKSSIRQQMFPEFYPRREKCTPDMEVVLDIPTQDWLPI